MHAFILLLALSAEPNAAAPADAKPPAAAAEASPSEARPLEEVLATEKTPNGKHIMVTTHILVHKPNAKKGMHVHFDDAKGSANVNIKKWDPKLHDLKPETTLLVTGELHYGEVHGGTPSIRYKVKEVGGRKYTDHRHWRTDKAIYIVNPTYEIVPTVADKSSEESKDGDKGTGKDKEKE